MVYHEIIFFPPIFTYPYDVFVYPQGYKYPRLKTTDHDNPNQLLRSMTLHAVTKTFLLILERRMEEKHVQNCVGETVW
jgi:hypothetical protein